ncbi:Uncharacterized protein FWK35_00028862, partial [Aphis craccivora]
MVIGLALRGHVEKSSTVSNTGNFKELCTLFAMNDKEFSDFLTEKLTIQVGLFKIVYLNYSVCERFIGFYDVSNGRGAEHISIEILSVLKKFGISDIPLVTRTYDGANVMSGSTSGVKTRIRDSHPEGIFIHCMAHKLNLVVTNTCRTIK